MLFETAENIAHAKRIANNYLYAMSDYHSAEYIGGISCYDFRLFRNGDLEQKAWLEVKKKAGARKWEYIGKNKWEFAKTCSLPCYYVVEGDIAAYLYNISDLIKKNENGEFPIFTREVVRTDRPINAQIWWVVSFPASQGRLIYCL